MKSSAALIAELDAAAELRWRRDPWSRPTTRRAVKTKCGKPPKFCSVACRRAWYRRRAHGYRNKLRMLPIYVEPCLCAGGRNYGCMHHGGGDSR